MTKTLVVIWNSCRPDHEQQVMDTDPWDNRTPAEKLAELRLAVEAGGTECTTKYRDSDGTPRWIFVGTEYALANSPVTAQELQATMGTIRGLSRDHAAPLIVPGTAMMAHPTPDNATALNYTGAFHNNEKKAELGKKGNVDEPVGADRTFFAGAGKASFDIGGTTFGIQICQDATGTVPLPSNVDVQIVTGRGVGVRTGSDGLKGKGIEEQAKKYIIVGDTYVPDIKFCGQARTVNDIQVKPYGGQNLGNSSLSFFEINI